MISSRRSRVHSMPRAPPISHPERPGQSRPGRSPSAPRRRGRGARRRSRSSPVRLQQRFAGSGEPYVDCSGVCPRLEEDASLIRRSPSACLSPSSRTLHAWPSNSTLTGMQALSYFSASPPPHPVVLLAVLPRAQPTLRSRSGRRAARYVLRTLISALPVLEGDQSNTPKSEQNPQQEATSTIKGSSNVPESKEIPSAGGNCDPGALGDNSNSSQPDDVLPKSKHCAVQAHSYEHEASERKVDELSQNSKQVARRGRCAERCASCALRACAGEAALALRGAQERLLLRQLRQLAHIDRLHRTLRRATRPHHCD